MADQFGIRVSEKGFVVHPRPFRQKGGNSLLAEAVASALNQEDDPLDTQDVNAVVLRWHQYFRVTAIDPWPQVRVRWKGGLVELAPRTMLGLLSPMAFETQMMASLRELKAIAPSKVELGWADVPVVEWERVSALPSLPVQDSSRGTGGAYRAGGPRAEEVAVAWRGPPSSLELMLDWLASSPERTWRDHPRQVRVTDDALYIERRGGELLRLSLSHLRHREGPPDKDAVYVFGRRTRLVMAHRSDGCAVRDRLDAWLEGERPDGE